MNINSFQICVHRKKNFGAAIRTGKRLSLTNVTTSLLYVECVMQLHGTPPVQ